MELHVRTRRLDTPPDLTSLVARRLGFALARFVHSIERVRVTFSDRNGPRGGVDKECRIEVGAVGVPVIIAGGVATSVAGALDVAAARASRTTARVLGRRRAAVGVG